MQQDLAADFRRGVILDFSGSFGKWVWKDDGKTLEFVPNNPTADRKKQGDKRQQKGHGVADRGRLSPSAVARGGYGQGRNLRTEERLDGYISMQVRQTADFKKVTLELVKSVAYDMMSQQEKRESIMFEELYGTPELDRFLLCLFNYFHWYLEKKAYEEKPNPMNIERSKKEMAEHAELCKNLATAQKIMGQAYGILVLGLGMSHYHHMHCGQSRVSNTLTDREMFETLYSFSTFCCWVSFKRPEFQTVKKELNRILRSETFNPATRVKHAPDQTTAQAESSTTAKDKKTDRPSTSARENTKDTLQLDREKTKDGAEEDGEDAKSAAQSAKGGKGQKTSVLSQRGPKMSPAEYRRLMEKRPPIKSIVMQRSPALVSMLPTAKEESSWLFKKRKIVEAGPEEEEEASLDLSEINIQQLQIGIVGQSMSLFNQQTLTPKGGDNEEEGEGHEGETSNGAAQPATNSTEAVSPGEATSPKDEPPRRPSNTEE